MNLEISSKKIGNPLLVELLGKLTDCFEKLGRSFYVIGATSRDLIMRQLANVSAQRRTKDLDIAIAIPDWGKFEEISQLLISEGFTKSKDKQRFYWKDYELDIVPYGGVTKDDDNIYWPPEEEIAMSVKGFDEVLKDAITVSIDRKIDIKIASLYGLFLLKLNAWIDRHYKTKKDAEDMSFILGNYFDANCDLNLERNFHSEVYERDDFDTYIIGAIWLAYDLLPLLNTEQLIYYRDIIKEETKKGVDSLFINQILESDSNLSYEQVKQACEEIADIFTIESQNRKKMGGDGSKEKQ